MIQKYSIYLHEEPLPFTIIQKIENLILWISPLQNDKGTKMVTHPLYNGSGHYKITGFDSRTSHEIRSSAFSWLLRRFNPTTGPTRIGSDFMRISVKPMNSCRNSSNDTTSDPCCRIFHRI